VDSSTQVWIADAIVAVHLAYVAFVVLGELGILLGVWRRWLWIRRPWLRRVHLVCAWIPALEGLAGITCPLTALENALREGEGWQRMGFLARILRKVLIWECDPHVFTASYLAFAALVTLTYVLVRPRPRHPVTRREAPAG